MNKSIIAFAAVAAVGTAFGAGLSSTSSYVQNGLVTHFDAIDNEKTGTHNPSATQWKDLVGNGVLTLNSKAFWSGNTMNCGTNLQQITGATSVNSFSATVEAALNLDLIGRGSASSTVWPFVVNGSALSFHGSGDSSRTFLFFVNSADPRPSVSSINDSTLSGTSDGAKYRIYRDGVLGGSKDKAGSGQTTASWWNLSNPNGGTINAAFHSFRVYNRALSDAELAQNYLVDRLRFHAWHVEGTGGTADWSAATWLNEQRNVAGQVPAATTNLAAVVINETLNVADTDNPAFAILSLEDGAALNVAAGAAVSVKELYVEGAKIAHGIYTGADNLPWLTGAGEVRVAGGADRGIPSLALPALSADGYYEFGDPNGRVGQQVGYKTSSTSYHYIKGEYPKWDDYVFPAGAKLRLKGYILLDTVPANTFSEVDFSQLKYVMLHSKAAFADGTTLVIPQGAYFRYQPGTFTPYTNVWWITSAPSINQAPDYICSANIHFDGGTFRVHGDGTSFSYPVFSGSITGKGTYYSTNYGKQSRFTGNFAFDCSTSGFQCGTAMWFDTTSMSAKMETVTLPNCSGRYTDGSWCGTGIIFGKDDSATPADHELYIKTLDGQASSNTDGNGKRWRDGGHLFVWGSNTVHVGEMKGSIHAVTRAEEFSVRQGYLGAGRKGVGPAYLIVDKFTSGNIYASTNFYCTVGSMAANTMVDYTYQSNTVNRTTLTVTNTCNAATTVKATDLYMLPSRVTGFAGKVQLTDAAEKSYTVPVDFAAGPAACQDALCIGSGTLDQAPATGSIDVTFPTDSNAAKPAKGLYPIATFTSVGDKFANWTVTVNGKSDDLVRGMCVTPVKNETGVWVRVHRTGLGIVVR